MARILVVDDEPSFLRMLQAVLSSAGHEVVGAADGAQALRAFQERPADLVVTDLFMPEKDGIEIIRELKKSRPSIPIIAISGGIATRNGRVDLLPLANRLGTVRQLAKPFDRQGLLSAVDEALAGPGPA